MYLPDPNDLVLGTPQHPLLTAPGDNIINPSGDGRDISSMAILLVLFHGEENRIVTTCVDD